MSYQIIYNKAILKFNLNILQYIFTANDLIKIRHRTVKVINDTVLKLYVFICW